MLFRSKIVISKNKFRKVYFENNLKNALKILDISSGTFYKFVNMYIDKNEIKKSTITKQK